MAFPNQAKRILISDEEVKKGHKVSLQSNAMDLNLLESYLKGKSIDQLSVVRNISRQSIEVKIKLTALTLRTNCMVQLEKCDPREMLQETNQWLRAIEYYKHEQLLNDPNSMIFYIINFCMALSKDTFRTVLKILNKKFYEKYGEPV